MWALSTRAGWTLVRPSRSGCISCVTEGLVAAPFLTVVAPVPPRLPPTLARPQVVDHRWQSATDGYPSRLYRASLAFPQPQVASLAALAAQFDGEWTARHDQLDIADGDPGQRAVPRVVGHETDPSARVRGWVVARWSRRPAVRTEAIPDVGPPDYRVWASDMFGRFGQPVDFTVEPPPRPVPPPPVLRYHLERAEIDPLVSADESPGVIRLMVAIPHAFPASRFTPAESQLLGSAIVVPRIDDLAAGSWTIESLTLKLGGSNRTVGTTDSGFTEVELPLPRSAPATARTLDTDRILHGHHRCAFRGRDTAHRGDRTRVHRRSTRRASGCSGVRRRVHRPRSNSCSPGPLWTGRSIGSI